MRKEEKKRDYRWKRNRKKMEGSFFKGRWGKDKGEKEKEGRRSVRESREDGKKARTWKASVREVEKRRQEVRELNEKGRKKQREKY